jgi:predicted acylesterase/phospholipase RssA/energy-coupling factor transporter ATP-binding protein EcfA2
MCKTCWDVVHKEFYMGGHKPIPYDFYQIVNGQISMNAGEAEFIDDGERSTLAFVNPIDFKLNFGRSYYELGGALKPTDQPAVVSFVGPTGAGKSLLLRMLMVLMTPENFPAGQMFGLPIPGSANAQSTSSDIHLYLTKLGCEENVPLIFLDAEGTSGNLEPKGLGYFFKSFASFLYGSVNNNSYLQKRRDHVENSYPKVQYLFSDIICYVTDCSWKRRQSIVENLLSWATKGVTGIVNIHVKPKLFIVFNKAEYDNVMSQNATSEFFEGIEPVKSEICNYYYEPEVILIPNACLQLADSQKKIEYLKAAITSNCKTIRDARKGAGYLRTTKTLRRTLYQAVVSLNCPEDGSIHIENGSPQENPISAHLENFFMQCLDRFGYDQAVKMLKCRLRDIPFIHTLRTVDVGLPCGPIARLISEKKNVPVEPIELPQKQEMENFMNDEDVEESSTPPDIPRWNHILESLDQFASSAAPCGAAHTFDSMNGPIDVRCECTRRPHAFHAAKRSYKVDNRYFLKLLGSITELPASWDNQLDGPSPEPLDLYLHACRQLFQFPRWTEEIIFKNHYARISSYGQEHKVLATMLSTCLGCVLAAPSERLECGHVLCSDCCEEMYKYKGNCCPICDMKVNWKKKELKKEMGYRILCLDGGGVRGIVELVALKHIEKALEIPFKYLFDAIFATSTGSVLLAALCFTNAKWVKDVEPVTDRLVQAVFTKREKNSWIDYITAFWRGYIYDPAKFDSSLSELDLKRPMLFCNDDIKIGFTSCLYETDLPAVLFTNYNRDLKSSDPMHRLNYREYTVRDAVRASSAAGFYFPPFLQETTGYVFTDGGMQNNCPALIALEEAQQLWPHHKCDILLSLGTGSYHPFDEKQHDIVNITSITGFLHSAVDLTTSTKRIWDQVLVHHPHTAMRIDPKLSEKIGLDEVSKLETLRLDAESYLKSHDGTRLLSSVTTRLYCSLFYIEPLALPYGSITFMVKSRITIPMKSRKILKMFRFSFSHDISQEITQQEIQSDNKFQQTGEFEMKVEIKSLPAIRPLTLKGRVFVEMNREVYEWPISGEEYVLTVLSEL